MGLYPQKTIIQKDTPLPRHPVFIAALFTVARTWKQPKWPSTKEWVKKMWYIYAMEKSFNFSILTFSVQSKRHVTPWGGRPEA